MLFTAQEIEELKVQAKEEAKALLMKELLGQLTAKSEAKEEVVALEDNPKLDDWVLEPITPAESEFKTTSLYNITLRVNRLGTVVQIFDKDSGEWFDKSIQARNGNQRHSPWVSIPNRYCSASKNKSGFTNVLVARIVAQAFIEMPQYLQDVLYTKQGPSILFGLDLVYQKDNNRQNSHVENLKWIDEVSFQSALRKKLKRHPNLSLT